MFGWFVLLLLVFIFFFFFLSRRGRKRLQVRLAELSSRVAQVEELLLEICAVLEEKEPIPELLPAETEEALFEEERDVISSREVRDPKLSVEALPEEEREVLSSPSLARTDVNSVDSERRPPHQARLEAETREKTGEHPREKPKKEPSDQSREKAPEKQPEQKVTATHGKGASSQKANNTTAQPQAASSPRGREINQERLNKIDPSTLPERSKRIIELLQQGLSVKEIARTTGMGQGEVQLIIDLYLQ
ncbi:MAG: hypothetical protein GX050_09925 [Firmicutes bacterium]|nr:hypothetical protein [Bacillota bacterium]